MGGHGHDHHKAPYEIPDYRIYKIEDAPELLKTQRALASMGLKDPWLRNEVWRYDPKMWGTRRERQISAFTRGLRTGLVLLGITLVGTFIYDKMVPSKHGHGHDGH